MSRVHVLALLLGAFSSQGVALAQALLYCPGPSSTREDVAVSYTGTDGTGPVFDCQNASSEGCLRLGPGSCMTVGQNASGYIQIGMGCNPTVDVGTQTRLQDNQVVTVYLTLQNSGAIRHLTGPVPVEGVLRHVPAALGTCNATNEFGVKADSASGVSTGARSRVCLCTSDGGGTPAYEWRNIGCPNEAGTSTTCPVCP